MEIPFELDNVTTGVIHDYFSSKDLPKSYIKTIADNTATWYEVPEFLSNFRAFKNPEIDISLDWSPIRKQLLEGFSSEETISGKAIINDEYANQFFSYLEISMCDLFLILNLSSPGSFNLYNVKIPDGSALPIEFRIDGDRFDALQCSSKEYWNIDIDRIPLDNVISWYYGLNIGMRQVAKTNMERALFSILQYCQMQAYCINESIWLRSAMGALYPDMTPPQVVEQLLKNNIANPANINMAYEFIGKLYDLSSQFLNGYYGIWHPVENDCLDCNVDKNRDDLINISNFTLSVIINTIQKYIRKHI